ncbi:hypothetical protein ED352_07455 [Muribaculaceae bacterium Isolate-002 (NCI)]|nr:hypothetical protein ED352_07455 [Muribaculaceae bacterium Isolate-002 (NCI)]
MEAFKGYFAPFQRIAKLYIHSGKLSLAEVLTQLLAAIAIAFVCLLFVIISLAFVSYGVIEALSQHMATTWAYLIVGGFYLLLIILMIIFKRTIIINPIARFLSKIILDAPDTPNNLNENDNEEE